MIRIALALAMTLLGMPALAAVDDLRALLDALEDRAARTDRILSEREATFRAARDRQAELTAAAQAELSELRDLKARLTDTLTEREQAIAERRAKLTERGGEIAELEGVVRESAAEVAAVLEDSLISAARPGRAAALSAVIDGEGPPRITDIETLWRAMLDEMVATAEVARFTADRILPNGDTVRGEALRFGPFVAISGGSFLRYLPAGEALLVPSRQPPAGHRRHARRFEAAIDGESTPPSHLPMTLDPTRGALLALESEVPTLPERLAQGGAVGYTIVSLGVIGFVIAAVRGIALAREGRRIARQARDPVPRQTNALGRVLAAADGAGAGDRETLELKLDQAILTELPRISRGLPFLAVLGGVAPLLGLLGTVTGIIETFQSITLFGTGDPRLMSGGISEALVTTVLGLVVAIPILVLHSLLTSRSNALVAVLDQKATGLVAERLEAAPPERR